VANFGSSIIERVTDQLGAELSDDFSELHEIKNLAGENTGYVRTYKGGKLIKATHLSINVAPGARYFNIQITPQPQYDVPRFSLEGMVTVQGSQVSMDMFPDTDMYMDIVPLLKQMEGVNAVFEEAKKTDIDFRPSRLPHMRAFCSPYFLNVFKASGEQLPVLEKIANQYFDEWKLIFDAAPEVGPEATAEREKRRKHMADIVIAVDPDRQMIVQVYGEETTSAIESAVMY